MGFSNPVACRHAFGDLFSASKHQDAWAVVTAGVLMVTVSVAYRTLIMVRVAARRIVVMTMGNSMSQMDIARSGMCVMPTAATDKVDDNCDKRDSNDCLLHDDPLKVLQLRGIRDGPRLAPLAQRASLAECSLVVLTALPLPPARTKRHSRV